MNQKLKLFLVFASLILLIGIDQASKIYIKTHFYLGQEYIVIPHWFRIAFTENPGMAFGFEYGGKTGKYVLTIFRLIVSSGLLYLIYKYVHKGVRLLALFSVVLITSGAIGNLIDGIFYGVIFSESNYYKGNIASIVPIGQGYSDWFLGNVVDMLYFPMFHSVFPSWVPIWGGQPFTFFSPVFNFADACITVGLFLYFFLFDDIHAQ